MDEDKEAARKAGMDDFVTKPVDLETLKQAIVKAQNRYANWDPEAYPNMRLHDEFEEDDEPVEA